MADIFTSEIAISALPTKSVTLTPHRATVVREIHTTIQPGANELTIVDLDPTIDPDSIRVEGTGCATITDIQTAIVPRTEHFDDVYPPDDDSSSPSSSDEEDPSDDEDEELTALRAAIAEAETRLARARNNKASAQTSLDFLDGYGRALRPEHSSAEEVGAFLALYARQRAADASAHHDAAAAETAVSSELETLQGRLRRREERRAKAARAQRQAQQREKQLVRRKRAQRREQAARRREERRAFWTGEMGRVVVRLDGDVATPVEEGAMGKKGDEEGMGVVLVLRYVVPRAQWAPRYELSVRTPSAAAQLVYRAEYFNSSAETWRDAAVTLSTSEAAWSRLDEEVPVLTPWHIRLDAEASETTWNGVLEQPAMKSGGLFGPPALKSGGLFGPPAQRVKTGGLFGNAGGGFGNAQGGANVNANVNSTGSGSLFGSQSQPLPPPPAPGLFGSAQSQPAPASAFGTAAPEPTQTSVFAAAAPQPPVFAMGAPSGDTDVDADADAETIDDHSILSQTLDHLDSIKHDYGMTTTYTLPGTRTIEPSHHGRRHVLAELDLPDVTLSHLIVPKKRAAAFLRARVKNTSSVKLLRGRVGLTVDGIFLGSSMLGACAPDADFQVSLGVDPAIVVAYAKPLVRRVPGGFFASEDAAVFRRSCWVKNTKGVAVDLVVSDQVPVSQDEKLRVNVVEPKLENKEGARAKIEMDEETGSGEASMLKDGEVKWTIRLEPGREFRVVLEYETRRLVGR